MIKKYVYLVILFLSFGVVKAHNPNLSTLMIYEQNGKYILLIKSSLTGFEGEVKYNNKKDAYKTPEEFNKLLIEYFEKNCLVKLNGVPIKFTNTQIQLGHETTLFSELTSVPKNINTFYVKNSLFEDTYNNMCEFILTTNGLPQKQFVLNNDNQHEVNLKVEDKKWVAEETSKSFNNTSILSFLGIVLCILSVIGIIIYKSK